MIWYSYILWNDHHNKSLTSVTTHSYKIFFLMGRTFKLYSPSNIVLLTIVTMLYVTSPWRTYFISGSLYLLTLSTIFPTPYPPASGNYQTNPFFVSLSLGLKNISVLFFLDSAYKGHHTVFVFLWLILLSTLDLKFYPCCHKCQDFLSKSV